MNWKNRLVQIVVASLLGGVLLLNGCGGKNKEVIKIGVVGPLTGEGATYGLAMKRGIDLALDGINMTGGLLGKKVLAIYEDDKLNSKDGINGINKLIGSDRVQAIVGSAASKVTISIAPFAEKSKVVLISSISTADTIKYSGEYIFRNVPPNRQQGITAATFAFKDLSKRNAVVFYKNDDYGISLSTSFINEFSRLGGNVLFVDSYAPNTKNFREQLSKIKSKKPDVVFFPGNYEESGIILRQAQELDLNSAFIGGDGSYSPELVKIAGKSAENSYFTLMSLPPDTSKVFIEFKMNYKEKYRDEPDVYSVYSYDVTNIIIQAIKKCNSYDGEKIKNALYEIEFTGLTGKVKFDSFGEVIKDYSIYTIKEGNFILYKP